jgi:phage repressor protein C with HTH and peptisase S24 domain
MSIGERLQQARKALDLSQDEIASSIGSKKRGYQDNERGHSYPGGKVIEGFVHLGINANWLLTGKGTMHVEEVLVSEEARQAFSISEEEYDYVILYDAECSAGSGSWNEGCQPLTQLAFTKHSLRKKGLDAKTLSAIRVTGDSMEGDLSDGDAVLIDHSKIEVKGEGIYVIRLDGHLYAKRLQRTLDGVEIISTNKAYSKMHVPKERLNELDVIGQVVWAASWTI